MKTVWKGYISFGMVNIPVQLYSAVQSQSMGFRQLHNKTKSPIKYKRIDSETGEEVDWNDIVKGMEISKNQYVVIDKDELKEMKPSKTDSIEVLQFTDAGQISPLLIDKPYYIGPQKKGDKSYYLLKEALESSARVAIGRFVMRDKEYLAAIRSYKEGLLLTTLNYAYEVRDMNTIETLGEAPELKKEEKELAIKLVDQMTNEFRIENHEDTYAKELKELIEKKIRGEEIIVKAEEKRPMQTENLVEALKASLEA